MIFSGRTPRDLSWNELSRIIREVETKGEHFSDLTLSNPTQVNIAYPDDTLRELFSAGLPRKYSPSPRGLVSSREFLAKEVQQHHSAQEVSPDNIWLTSSTSEAYSYLFKLLANPGEEIAIPMPSYPLFQSLLSLEGIKPLSFPLLYDDGWRLDLSALFDQVSEKTKAIVLVNPNNPTGSYISSAEWSDLLSFCADRDLPMILDEVFYSYALEPDRSENLLRANEEGVLIFRLGGMSKLLGLPQAKLSWILAQGPDPILEEASHRLDWISDAYLSIPSLTQESLQSIFDVGQDIRGKIFERIRTSDKLIKECFRNSNVAYLQNHGGWSAILRLENQIDEEHLVAKMAKEDRTIMYPGFYFDLPFESSVVVSLLTAEKELKAGLQALMKRM